MSDAVLGSIIGALGVVVAATVSAALGFVIHRRTQRAKAEAQRPADMSAANDALWKWAQKLEARVEAVEGKHAALLASHNTLEDDVETLATDLESQHEWQKDGAEPPPPEIRARSIAVLARRRKARKDR